MTEVNKNYKFSIGDSIKSYSKRHKIKRLYFLVVIEDFYMYSSIHWHYYFASIILVEKTLKSKKIDSFAITLYVE